MSRKSKAAKEESLPASKVVPVSVRELITLVLRTGNLSRGGGFVTPARALEGTRAHQQIQKSRPEGYQSEVPVRYDHDDGGFVLRITGRVDGLVCQGNRLQLEEIKTVSGFWDHAADPLHWAQARIYAWIYAFDKPGLTEFELRLTYAELETGRIEEFRELESRERLAAFFNTVVQEYVEWVREWLQWCRVRDTSIAQLQFPFPAYRPGQRQFAVAVYRAIKDESHLFAEAPTGIGKTISVVFPAVKALQNGLASRIFYLTAKTSGRAAAQDALRRLAQGGLRLRAVTLTARDKICFNQGKPCDAATCPFAIGYYDRIKTALHAGLARESFDRGTIEQLAKDHQVCPFELSLDLASWSDLVIGDYNHAFDPGACLRRFFDEQKRGYLLLIDEAHNLLDRAREMFSAELSERSIRDLHLTLPEELAEIRASLSALARALAELATAPLASTAGPRLEPYASKSLPVTLTPILRRVLTAAETWLVQNKPAPFQDQLLMFYFSALAFGRTAEAYDEAQFRTIVAPAAGGVTLQLFCVDPAENLRALLKPMRAAIFFSATLTPLEFFRETLGGEPSDPVLRLTSPFPPANFQVLVANRIETTFQQRARSYDQVAQAIAATVQAKAGNYLAYFPSYAYLAEVLDKFRASYPELPVVEQRLGMKDHERTGFLQMFHESRTSTTLLGFAVLGGIFGEGIDLVGDRLIGAIVVGVGLPQICLERDLIQELFAGRERDGFAYAYLFPGMSRVLQAGGRVIRSDTDKGIVLLIDSRFNQRRYRELMPAWWQPVQAASPREILQKATAFWASTPV